MNENEFVYDPSWRNMGENAQRVFWENNIPFISHEDFRVLLSCQVYTWAKNGINSRNADFKMGDDPAWLEGYKQCADDVMNHCLDFIKMRLTPGHLRK